MADSVLVTGGGGFLGRHLARQFARDNWHVVGFGRSRPPEASAFAAFEIGELADAHAVSTFLQRHRPALVVHLAAPSSVPASLASPLGDLLAHVVPTATLLDSIRSTRCGASVLLVSSAAVYGNPARFPVEEAAPLAPISPYGFHKAQQELIAREYVALHGIRCSTVRIFSTYGEGLRRLAVWEIARRALQGDFTVHGTGKETRDYLWVGNVSRALAKVARTAPFQGEAINVGSGEAVSIHTLAVEIYRLLGIGAEPRFAGDALPGSPLRWSADVSRLRELGFEPPRWSEGLEQTLDWIKRSG